MKETILSHLSIITAEKLAAIREIKGRARYEPATIDEHGGYYFVETSANFRTGDVVGARFEDEIVPSLGVVTGARRGATNLYIVKMFSRAPELGECEVFEGELLLAYELQEQFLERVLEDNLTFAEKLAVTVAFKGPLERYRRGSRVELIGLDTFQRDAVQEIVSMDDGNLTVVVGPPGTGKTRVIVRAAMKLAEMGEKVLITSHTNRAVDSALERIPPELCVRVGYPDRIAPSVREATLERKVREHPEGRRLKIVERAIERAIARKRFGDLPELYEERAEILDTVGRIVIDETPIVGATILKSATSPLSEFEFDVVMIDEASQITIPLALLGMSRGRRYAVVGDHHQLPPVLKTVRNPTRYSAFVFLKERYPHRVRWLRVHYRSHPGIVELTRFFYEQPLIAAESCSNVKLEVAARPPLISPEPPVVFVDVPGREVRIGSSRLNPAEAKVCELVVRGFVNAGVKDIAVVAPYRAQIELLESALSPYGVEVGTVDAFQGREKDVVIFSITATRDLRFAADPNRLNVAFTRARKKLVIAGNANAILRWDGPLSHVITFCLAKKGYVRLKV